jgi:hypothetical protein
VRFAGSAASVKERWGSEIFIPFSNGGSAEDGRRRFGIGDIELQAPKYSFLQGTERIATAALAFTLPTVDEHLGLGESRTAVAA